MKTTLLIGLMILAACTAMAETIDFAFEFDAEDILYTPKAGYEQIDLPGCDRPLDRMGAPWLPAKFVHIRLPVGACNVSIRAEGDEALLRKGIVVYPSQPRVPRSRAPAGFRSADHRIYGSQAPWPARRAEMTGMYTIRGIPVVAVRLNPLRYRSSLRELYLAQTVRLSVNYELSGDANAPVPEAFDTVVDSMAINPGSFAPRRAPAAEVDYAVITSAALADAFQALVDYRAETLRARVVTVESLVASYPGVDAPEKIRNGIRDMVERWGLMYVVLGGDDTVAPVRYCRVRCQNEVENEMPSDLYYSCLDGNWDADGNGVYGESSDRVDLGFDVVVGRIPVRTKAEVSAYIEKLMAVEADPAPYEKRMLIGGLEAWHAYRDDQRPSDPISDLDGYAEFDADKRGYISDSEIWSRRLYCDGIRPFWAADTLSVFCDTLTSWDEKAGTGDCVQNNNNLRRCLDENWYHLFFSGHGDSHQWALESGEYTVEDAASMVGTALIVYTDACFAGRFDKDNDAWGAPCEPSLSEAFLRNEKGGAVAFIGCSRFGWGLPDAPPACETSDGGPSTVYGYRFYQRLHETDGRSVGLAFAMHKADMMPQCGADNAERWIQFGLNLQGDPAGLQ